MATSIQFYHLLHTSLPHALAKLIEKVLAQSSRAVVLVGSEAEGKRLSDALFAFDPAGFIPHGTARDAHAAHQPIYITWSEENPNQSDVLIITDGSRPSMLSGFAKVLDMFDGRDPEQVASARERWSADKQAGHSLQYIKQQESGGWKIEGA